MNGNNNFNNQFNNNGFNNSNNMQGNMMYQNQGNNGFNNQMPQNNFNQQQNQYQSGPMPRPMNNQFNNNSGQKNNSLGIIIGIVSFIAVAGIGYYFLGGKTLTCTKSGTSYGLSTEDVIKVKFQNDKIKSVSQTGTLDLGNYVSQKDEVIEMLNEEYEDEEGVVYSIKSQDDKIIVNLSATTEEGFEYFFLGNYNYDSLKEDLEDYDYTCN